MKLQAVVIVLNESWDSSIRLLPAIYELKKKNLPTVIQ
jgi:hypothetical protein